MLQKYQKIFCSHLFFLLLLFAITLIIFRPCLNNDFTNWDDPEFVVENQTIRDLSLPNLRNILSQIVVKNWHPLTMLSYSVEYHFFKLNPFVYHATNLLLHILNTLLVYVFIILLTQNKKIGFLTTLLFGIHPMHVESVAWIAERKDVLFTFFYLSSLIAYILFIKKNQKNIFLTLSFVLFFFSITSKVTAVSLPIVLLLLDYFFKREWNLKLLLQKIPFFALSLVAGIIILNAHKDVLTLRGQFEYNYSLIERFFLTNYGLLSYLTKLILPSNLCAIYPYPEKIGSFFNPLFYLSSLIIITIALFIFWLKNENKKLIIFGCLFFLCVISVNLPFSIIGEAMIADRYTYLSSIGFFLILSYFIFSIGESKKLIKTTQQILILTLISYFAWLMVATNHQCKIWKNSISLWSDVIAKNPKLGFAYYNRGVAHSDLNENDAALADFNNTIKYGPIYLAMDTLTNRGQILAVLKNYSAAIEDFSKVINTNPRAYLAYNNRGLAYLYQKQFDLAIDDFNQALMINPQFCTTYNNLGIAYLALEELNKAMLYFEKSVSLDANFAPAYYNISKVFYARGFGVQAWHFLVKAQSLGLKPSANYVEKVKSILAQP